MISVLCVHGETPLYEQVKQILEETKEFTVDTAGSAEDALAKIKATSYDAIISDYQLNGIDGLAFLKSLRSSDIKTPFIICIDNGLKEVIISAFENDADFYIVKDGETDLHCDELALKIRAAVRHCQSEDTLTRSEEKYRAYTEHSPVGIFVVDRTGRYLDVNPAACRMLGYNCDELLGMHIPDITPGDRVALELERFNSTLLRTGRMSIETILKKKDGTEITVTLDATRLPDDSFMAFCIDITDKKIAEEALRESEQRFRELIEASPDMIWKIDTRGNFTYISSQCLPQLGYSPGELIGTSMLSLIQPESVNWVQQQFLSHIGKNISFHLLEVPAYHRDGRPLVIEIRSVVVKDNQGTVTGFQGIARDITDHKAAEAALAESELQYRMVVENASEGIVVTQDGLLTFVNPKALAMTESTPDKLLNRPFTAFIHPDDRELVSDRYQRRVRGMDVPTFYDFRVFGEEGRITWVQISSVLISWKGRPATLNFLSDITERKEMELRLLTAQRRLKEIHRLARIGTWYWDMKANTTTWSEELYALSGRDPSLPPPEFSELSRIYTPASWERLTAAVQRAITTGEPYDLELEVIGPSDGIKRWINAFGGVETDLEGQVTGLHGSVQDINARKMTEEALRESEIRFRDLFNNLSAGVAIYEPVDDGRDFIFRDINHAAVRIDRIKKDEVIGRSVLSVFPGIKEFGLFEVFQRVARTGIAEKHPVSHYADDRLSGWRENYVYRLNSGEIVAIYEDQTEKKKAEEALRESEEQYREFFTTSRDSIFIISPQGTWIDFNETSLEMLGYDSRESLNSVPVRELYVHPGDQDTMFASILQEGYVRDYPVRLRKQDGTVIDTLITAVPQHNSNGGIKAIIGSVRDITDRKAAEEALRRSEQIYKNLVENISDVLFSVSPENIITYISPVVSMYGIPPEHVEGRRFSDFIVQDDLPVAEAAARTVLSGREHELDFRIRNPSGEVFSVHVSIHPEWTGGEVTGIAGIMKDITAQKDLERLKVEALKKIDENLIEMAILNDQIRNPLACIMAAADLAGGDTADDIIRQVREIDAMINKIDRKWVESEKVREFLKKYYGVGRKL